MSRYNCKFDYYLRDTKTAEVVIEDGIVTTVAYTDEKLHLPFGFVSDRNVTKAMIETFYERHCVPRNRVNIADFLKHYGLEKYDAYEICRITGGQMTDHMYRIEFKD